jgi:cystathionine gamma-lyase
MKTLAVRIKAQNENAMALAEYLSGHRKVKMVHYPGLGTHPQHGLARRQMRGFGGMLSFELKGNGARAARFVERIKVGYLAASLGGVETLVSQPALLSHHQLSESDREKTGIQPALIRVSVGIEDKEDLVADFRRALSQV